jgi:exopolyphosphatase/guanosine-5'-triphosphate,3'-diphosphate pyrophosphatase
VIDIGSNSVLCLVAARAADGRLMVLADLLETTRLASGLRDGGTLDPEARARTRRAVASFAERARELGASRIVALGTAAMRVAGDGPAFAREVEEASGVRVAILSGAEEARLAYEAVAPGGEEGPLLAVDVGGRSTELVLGEGARIEDTRSLPLGALSLTEEVLRDRPAAPDAVAAVRAHVARVLAGDDLPARARVRGARLVASGGTATALAALDLGLTAYDRERVHGYLVETERLVGLAVAAGAAGLGPLDPGRRRILPAGAVVLESVARGAGASRVVVSDRGIRHAHAMALLSGASGAP